MKPLSNLFEGYYNPLHILSYNRLWMISTGSRSIGKSTGWGIWLIYQYLQKDERFIYLRRTRDEVKMTAPTALDSAWYILRDAGYPVYEIIARRGYYYLKRTKDSDPEIIGQYIGLSEAYKYKSANFGDNGYRNILYDECICLDPTHYLGTSQDITSEYRKLDELYVTVDRSIGHPQLGLTRCICLANLSTMYNPIYIGLGIDRYVHPDSKVVCPQGTKWVLEQTRSVKATEDITRKESVYSTTEEMLMRYNNDNVALYDNFNLVKVIKEPMDAICNVKYKSHIMGVYRMRDASHDYIYICDKPSTLITLALTTGDLGTPDYHLPHSPQAMPYYRYIKDKFQSGKVRFGSRSCQYDIQTYMLLMPLK